MLHLKLTSKAFTCQQIQVQNNFSQSSYVLSVSYIITNNNDSGVKKEDGGGCFHDGCGNVEQNSLLPDYSADTSKILFVSVKIRAAIKAGRPSA